MKFGACLPYENISLLKKEGFDYIELNFSLLSRMTNKEFSKLYKEIERHSFPAESYNSFFPADIRITGESIDISAIKQHAENGCKRAAEIGGKIGVIGSAKARNLPDGYDVELGKKQFAECLKICGDIASSYGMTIVVEPLMREESNFINTVADGLELVKMADRPNVRCLADFYHMFMTGESLDAFENSNGLIAHLHIARANSDRRIPTLDDIDACRRWAEATKKIGYNSRLSLEGDYQPNIKKALENVKPILELFK